MYHEKIPLACDYRQAGLITMAENTALLHAYVLDENPDIQPPRARPAIVICPGGGYARTSFREGEHIAIRFNALGFNAFVLKYSCEPAVFPAALLELAAAVALVRSKTKEWNVAPGKLIVSGFSAGGHLAACLGVLWNREIPLETPNAKGPFFIPHDGLAQADLRPDGLVLSYPVITSGEFAHRDSFRRLLGNRHEDPSLRDLLSLERQVSRETPPTFLWHTFEDTSVPVENSLLFASALRRNGVPFELHVYQRGKHGLAAANEETAAADGWGVQRECQNWIDMTATWIRNLAPPTIA